MSSRIITDYERAFITRAHQLLIWGYQAARLTFNRDTEEEVISQFLFEKMEHLVEDSLTLPPEYHRFDVRNEAPVSSGGRTGKRRKKVDIVLVDCETRLPRYKLFCEAKRLCNGTGYDVKKYTNDGMMRFVKEDYAAEYSFAAMLGYMQSDDPNHWSSELQNWLKDSTQTALQITSPLKPCQIIADLPQEWTSQHNRNTRSPILLYHIFLDCI